MAKGMGFNLDKLTEELFTEAKGAFRKIGASVKIDRTDSNNPVLTVKRGRTEAKIAIDKNEMMIGSKKYELEGITVESDGKVYVPKHAVELLRKNS
ncbi:stalk domain-containing protein [Metabacillus sp. 84]